MSASAWRRGALALAVALVIVVAAGTAAAHPVRRSDGGPNLPPPDRDPILIVAPPPSRPPPAPKPPRGPLPLSLGLRYGFASPSPVAGFGLGFDAGLVLDPRARLTAAYEYVIRTDMSGPPDAPPVHGRGHRLQVGARLTMADTTLKKAVRFYADLDGAIGAVTVLDRGHPRALRVEEAIGVRLGYEMLAPDVGPQPTFGWHLTLRAQHAGDDWGMGFTIGTEWGPRPRPQASAE